MLFNTVFLTALAAHVLAAPRESLRVVHERRAVVDPAQGDRLSRDSVIPIRIGLKQSNIDDGYEALMDVSDPKSANYGKHWTLDEVRAHFAPSNEAIEAVKAWLVEAGIASDDIGHTEDNGWIGVNLPTWKAEELLKAEYHEHHTSDGAMRIGCDEYSLPLHISRHVDFIKPGITLSPPVDKSTFTRRDLSDLESRDTGSATDSTPYGQPQMPYHDPPKKRPIAPMPDAQGGSAQSLSKCGVRITPACIRALYNIPKATQNVANALGVLEFTPDAYSQTNLNDFFKAFAPNVPQGTHPTLVSIDGGKAPVSVKKAGGESDIDFDLTISLTYPQQVTLYQVGPTSYSMFSNKQQLNELTFLTTFLDAIDGSFCTTVDRQSGFECGTATLTKVLSVSYGTSEVFLGQKAVIRSCNEIMKLSMQGSTIVFASGDYGVANGPTAKYNGCINVSQQLGVSGTIFSPDFPADCPYVLAVGGTQLAGDETVNDPESVMDVPGLSPYPGATFGSGGGFSNYFKRPSYQDSAVQTYLSKYVPPYKSYIYNGNDIYSGNSNIGANGGIYNSIGRGFPDVSANGVNFTAYINNELDHTYGTSLAAPIWASILTLINNERDAAGQSSVGFVQPVLYANPDAFNDITSGSNPGCGTNGFPASPGWDPSTGLGTPDYTKLSQAFASAASG